jgi:integration host factor subunit beta
MTKSDLIERLCLGQKLPKGKAELLVDTIFECLEQALRRGERIEIRGFGSFEIRSYKAYQGRNPKTGVQVPVREKRLPFFKVGKELKERVNPNEAQGSDGAGGNGGGGNGSGGHGGRSVQSSSGGNGAGAAAESSSGASGSDVGAGAALHARE